MADRTDNSADGDLAQLSPDYGDQELEHMWDGNKFSTPFLLPDLVATDLSKINQLAVPLILIEGRHDMNVNSEVAAAWFNNVQVSRKTPHLVRTLRSHADDRGAGQVSFLAASVRTTDRNERVILLQMRREPDRLLLSMFLQPNSTISPSQHSSLAADRAYISGSDAPHRGDLAAIDSNKHLQGRQAVAPEWRSMLWWRIKSEAIGCIY